MTKKEKQEMKEALSKIDNKFEMMAYIWTYGNKEIKSTIIVLQWAIILFFVLKFTPALDIIIRLVERLLGI